MGCAFIRIVLPLLLVARHGSSVEHREGALGFFDRWQANGIVPGLSGLLGRKIKYGE
jgi:hypothetical protein